MAKDWSGNSRSAHAILGARNYAQNEREIDDYYATEPKAVELLLEKESFSPRVWECACGQGHIAEVLKAHGYEVRCSDLVNRGYPDTETANFLLHPPCNENDIVTNPPYKYGKEFVEHALDISATGVKVAMFLKLQFLEGKARRELFKKYPPKKIYVSSSRLHCAMNGDFEKYAQSSAVCYAWFIWEKGYEGKPTIDWI